MASKKTIDAKLLAKMFLAGAKTLDNKKEWINELNVFPVPDGDTGTNMTLTIMSAVKEVNSISESDMNMEVLSKAISSGSLRGARGNSGVILSQLLRGFCKEIKTNEKIDADCFGRAMGKAVETAYKAVMKPKEGTILTVARGISEKTAELISAGNKDFDTLLPAILEHGKYVLSTTPDLLPVLKQAGVVDSGGQGLIVAMSGAIDCYFGKEINLDFDDAYKGSPKVDSEIVSRVSKDEIETADIKFGYCTEFIIMLEKEFPIEEELKFKEFLSSIGDSIVCVADDEIVKVHVHTNHPGQAFEKGLEYGSLTRMKVDNMREEHNERVIKDAEKLAKEQKAELEAQKTAQKKEEPKKKYGFVSIAAGSGLANLFRELGVDYVIEGGQTMNPSTEDMLNAIAEINAENIYILPNNKNIIMAAEQAKVLTEDKNIVVIPSKTVPQGISAMINFMPESEPDENEESMTNALGTIKTGSVTYAVRTTNIDGYDIEKDDIMALGDSGLLAVGKEINDVVKDAVSKMADEDSELITVYYGEDIKREDAEAICDELSKEYPTKDVEVQEGLQPVYYYLISVE